MPFSSRQSVPEDSVPVIGLTTNLVEPRELGCRRGVDSEVIVRKLAETVPGVMVGIEEDREVVEDTAAGSGSSWNIAVGEYEDLGKHGGDCLGENDDGGVDRGVMGG